MATETKMSGNPDGNDNVDMIEHVRTNASVAIPLEVFERRYLTPNIPNANWYKRLGNPTPLCVFENFKLPIAFSRTSI